VYVVREGKHLNNVSALRRWSLVDSRVEEERVIEWKSWELPVGRRGEITRIGEGGDNLSGLVEEYARVDIMNGWRRSTRSRGFWAESGVA
jgi:hypothetical protein